VGSNGVVNLSLGGDSESEILTAIINDAAAYDITFTASAGNKELWYRDAFLGVPMQFPAATQKRLSSQRFANNTHLLEQVIGVGALGHYQGNGWNPAEFSQRGGFVDIAAPGVNLVFPRTTDPYYGTSFAAPFVAGAVLLTRARGVSPFDVLSSGCTPMPAAFRPFVGCGILDLSGW
jgi:subtilisin family serine protease